MCRKGSQFSGHLTENRECAKSQEPEPRAAGEGRNRPHKRGVATFLCAILNRLARELAMGSGGSTGAWQSTCSFATSWRKAAINAALLIEHGGKGMRQGI